MADAEVIPLGTRGKPGRGTGSSKPSSAARTLAAPGGAKPGATKKPVPTPPPDDVGPAVDPVDPADENGQTAQAPPADEAATPAPERTGPLEVTDRTPTDGIPVSDWLAALTSAAVEVFGERWEQPAAQLLAFLRRRVTGDSRSTTTASTPSSPSGSCSPRSGR